MVLGGRARAPGSQKSIVRFVKGKSSSKTTKKAKAAKKELEEKVPASPRRVSFQMPEPAKTEEEAPAEEVPAVSTTAVEKKEVDMKKIIFAAAVLGIAAKVLADKAGKKKVVVPAAPEYTTKCTSEALAKKTGVPQVCFRIPKKIVFQFKNKELKMDLPSLFFKK